jgi:hypothetical protein
LGMVKQAMIEAESYVWEETEVSFICPECGKDSDGYVEIPKIDREFPDDIDTDIEVQCNWCDELLSARLLLGSNENSVTFYEYPDTKIRIEPAYFDSYRFYDWDEEYFFEISDLLSHKSLSADEIRQKTITKVIKETLFHNMSKAIALFRW